MSSTTINPNEDQCPKERCYVKVETKYINQDTGILNVQDHQIKENQKEYKHPAFEFRKIDLIDKFCDYNSEDYDSDDSDDDPPPQIKKILKQLEPFAIQHPNSNGIVKDFIHPSHYPYIHGVSRAIGGELIMGEQTTKFDYKEYPELRLSRIPTFKCQYRWLPSIFYVDSTGVSLKSYINDLFVPDDIRTEVEKVICTVFGVAIESFQSMGDRINLPVQNLYEKNLQVVVKCASYELNPGQEHEGVWHVEGVPDEHIIMTAIYYYEDELPNSPELRFRREVTEAEEEHRIMMFGQDTIFSQKDCDLQIDLGHVKTKVGNMYVWTNGAQHKLRKIMNNTDQVVKRSMLVYFLVNPAITIVDTSMVRPQYEYVTNDDAYSNMINLMKERQHIKVQMNQNVSGEISYCEH